MGRPHKATFEKNSKKGIVKVNPRGSENLFLSDFFFFSIHTFDLSFSLIYNINTKFKGGQ